METSTPCPKNTSDKKKSSINFIVSLFIIAVAIFLLVITYRHFVTNSGKSNNLPSEGIEKVHYDVTNNDELVSPYIDEICDTDINEGDNTDYIDDNGCGDTYGNEDTEYTQDSLATGMESNSHQDDDEFFTPF